MELESVITGLRDKAKTGNAQAASALLAYLTRFPVQQGSGEDWQDKALEDMTPDELAFAEAWALRQVNRAMRRAEGLRKGAGRGGYPPEVNESCRRWPHFLRGWHPACLRLATSSPKR
jgi:hypothetical protein